MNDNPSITQLKLQLDKALEKFATADKDTISEDRMMRKRAELQNSIAGRLACGIESQDQLQHTTEIVMPQFSLTWWSKGEPVFQHPVDAPGDVAATRHLNM